MLTFASRNQLKRIDMKIEKHLMKRIPREYASELHKLGMKMKIARLAIVVYPRIRIAIKHGEPTYKEAFSWLENNFGYSIQFGRKVKEDGTIILSRNIIDTFRSDICYYDEQADARWTRFADKALKQFISLAQETKNK